jgi:glycosyltransferase involved in cell wall biosynthesis
VRVAFFGNIANVHFRLAHLLRERGAIDAHVFIGDSAAPNWRPEVDDPSLADGYPDWIHFGHWVNARSVLRPRTSALARELSAFDLVVASGVGPVFAQHAGTPWVFLATGGDLTVKPFPLTFWRWYPSWARRFAQVVAGAHQRAAIRSADRVLAQPFAPMVDALDRLGVPEASRSHQYFPLPVDLDRFSPDGPVADEPVDSDFVVFHPSRLVLDDSPKMRRTGQWKGNDILLRGFARFVRSGVCERPRLVLVDQAASRARDEALRLIDDLDLADHVHWVEPADGVLLTQPEMAAHYRRADVVAVEFGIGWFGYVALEGAACGRPVVCHIDEPVMRLLYPWHPIQNAEDEVQVGERLAELAASPERRRAVGARSREWIEEFHAPDALAERYLAEFERLADELTVIPA